MNKTSHNTVVWTLAAWCELRNNFRSFRLDRMKGIAAGTPFEAKPGHTLDDFLKRVRSDLPPGG
jgi:predicted DNA-binding transcriptional regulator YafY